MRKAEVVQVLRQAADLVEPPGRWTTKYHARDEVGNPVYPMAPSAVCWCIIGACYRITNDMFLRDEAISAIRRFLQNRIISFWNDGQTNSEPVVAALRGAADQLEAS